ncbi:MAG: amidohydrolase family protein [Desulfobacterota bacterium]|nr:amidohydrolase family protein [Thermodesulfobacteriota bacterium]
MQIIDSHTHWGPSLSLWGVNVTTEELLTQAKQSGVGKIVIFPFPSTAIANAGINDNILEEAKKIEQFIPYYYIPENLNPIPKEKGFYGGKWHWVRGIQDCSSNYEVLNDPQLDKFIEASEEIDLPIVFEEELAFTAQFIKRTNRLKVIIPHLGMLGGNPLDFLEAFKERENVYFDTALASSGLIKKFIEAIGPERILFGSDIPFGTMRGELEKILSLEISDNEKELLLGKNLAGLCILKL